MGRVNGLTNKSMNDCCCGTTPLQIQLDSCYCLHAGAFLNRVREALETVIKVVARNSLSTGIPRTIIPAALYPVKEGEKHSYGGESTIEATKAAPGIIGTTPKATGRD